MNFPEESQLPVEIIEKKVSLAMWAEEGNEISSIWHFSKILKKRAGTLVVVGTPQSQGTGLEQPSFGLKPHLMTIHDNLWLFYLNAFSR